MIRAFVFLLVVGAAALVASCETMSAEECVAADWRAIGYQDAASNGASRLADRTESCAEKSLAADPNAYQTGFDEGMRAFCYPPAGFAFASRGGSFNGYCPADLQEDFTAAYFDGRRIYDADQELQSARSRVSSLESQIREIDDNIGSRERSLAEATTDQERSRHRAEIDRLRRERRDVNDDIRTAQARVPYLQRAADDLRYQIGSRWR